MIHSMRLSLKKGTHADLSSTARQEIGVKPCFGLEWDTQHSQGSRGTCSPRSRANQRPLRRINQYTGSPEMTSAKPGQVVAGRLINKQSTTVLAPNT